MRSLIGVIGISSAVIGLAMVAAPTAEAFPVTVDGVIYDVNIVYGTWQDNAPELMKTPWYTGDYEEIAKSLAKELHNNWADFVKSQNVSPIQAVGFGYGVGPGFTHSGDYLESAVRIWYAAESRADRNPNVIPTRDVNSINVYWLIGIKP